MGGRDEKERIYAGAGYREAPGGEGSAEPREHGRGSEPQALDYGTDLLSLETGVHGVAGRSGPKAQGAGEGEREAQETGGRSDLGQCHTQGGGPGKLLSPLRRRKVVIWVCESLRISLHSRCKEVHTEG
jgi:hypothetical protein